MHQNYHDIKRESVNFQPDILCLELINGIFIPKTNTYNHSNIQTRSISRPMRSVICENVTIFLNSILQDCWHCYFFSFNNSFTLLTGNLSSISTTSNRFNGNSFSPIRERYSLTALRSTIIFPCPAQ